MKSGRLSLPWRILTAVLAAISMQACQTVHPVVVQKQPVAYERVHIHGGSPLSGYSAFTSGKASSGLVVDARFFILNRMPENMLLPLGSQDSLVLTGRGRRATLSVARLTRGARFGEIKSRAAFTRQMLQAAGGVKAFAPIRSGLFAGAYLRFQLRDHFRYAGHTGGPLHRAVVSVDIWLPAGPAPVKPQIALAASRYSSAGAAGGLAFNRETQIVATPAAPGKYAFILPFRFVSGSGQAVAVEINIRPAGPADKGMLEHAAILAARPPLRPASTADKLNRPDLVEALGRLRDKSVRRAALIYLSAQTGAHLCEDTVLTVNDSQLAPLAENIFTSVRPGAPGLSVADLGWQLDRAAYEFLYTMQKKSPLVPELQTVLSLHLGEAAYHSSSLDQIAGALGSRRLFERQIIAENYIYLQDTSPADRIGAFDWLNRRGWAPPGYHPLGPINRRNAALDKAVGNPAFLKRIQP